LDVQDLDARVTSGAHERVAVLSLRPYDTVVVELLVARRQVVSHGQAER
jgi:hypothetical protein